MSATDQDSQTAYFLGVEGEQTGPFSEEDLTKKISQGQISMDALVWWEGQSDWERISDVPKFKSLFESKSKSSQPTSPPIAPQSLDKNLDLEDYTVGGSHPTLDWVATFAQTGKEPLPVYDSRESYFKHEKVIPIKVAALAIAFCLIGFGALIVWRYTAPQSKKVKTPEVTISPKNRELEKRKTLLAQARSTLLLEPVKSTQQLSDLLNQNAKDDVAKEASEILLNYYRQNKQFEKMGDLFLKLGKYAEAAKTLSADPAFSAKTEEAFFKAFQNTTGKEGADFLIEDIQLLIKPLENLPLAKERILLFEKTFPGLTHPFGYYLLPIDQQINSIFSRLTPTFVDLLLGHIAQEFPQITLVKRPLVEVKRNSSGSYRIIGRYNGDILLRSDRLRGTSLVYWLVDNQWLLVDTNLTSDRQKFASATRKKYEATVFTPEQILAYFERQFQGTFPNNGLHENVTPKSNQTDSSRPD